MSKLTKDLDALAEKYEVPSITTWEQGYFLDLPQYSSMSESWKKEQKIKENTLIRPGGGTNNGLFQVSGAENNSKIAAYLQEVSELLRDYES